MSYASPDKTNNLYIGKIGLAVSCIKLHNINKRRRTLYSKFNKCIPNIQILTSRTGLLVIVKISLSNLVVPTVTKTL